ncbi:XYPPX repeat family protein [Histomonas meleagridis]|uniref:XYPPX repeat family protein n=1 Tax=Histomonas meleagridis TaxID=135588 RepID=UPI00355A61CD|nr:XYPPX repeat family protein [Histomonas meleagridis]KAH0799150.1 XYPPX repeat family protein [Histomonas meleagridis]
MNTPLNQPSYGTNQPNYGTPQYQQPYNNNYQPGDGSVPPAQPYGDVQANPYNYHPQIGNYKYDYEHINYQQIQVEQLPTIPCDQSAYSYYWDNQQAFEPQNYSVNTRKETKCNDLIFVIFFLINLAITLIVFIYLAAKKDPYDSNSVTNEITETDLDVYAFKSSLWKAIFVGFFIALIVNAIHLVYISFAPIVYIKFGFFIGVIISLVLIIYPMFHFSLYWYLIFPGILLLIALICYCVYRQYIPFSASILKHSVNIMMKNPSLLLVLLIESIVDMIIGILFSLMIFFVEYKHVNAIVYVYLVFSYYWISYTFGYVMYMTGAGLAGTWYFLNGTAYYPRSPVWQSFKRASTTSFGSSTSAALWLAIIEACRAIIRLDLNDDDNNSAAQVVYTILKCIAHCIICVIESCFSWINRYALIYCALFGVPYKEGCRRFMEMSCNRYVEVLIESSMVSSALTYNLLVFVLCGAGLGYFAGKMIENSDVSAIFSTFFALFFTLGIYLLCDFPIETMSDTLIICFAEAPERLRTTASDLYQSMKDKFSEKLRKKLEKRSGMR